MKRIKVWSVQLTHSEYRGNAHEQEVVAVSIAAAEKKALAQAKKDHAIKTGWSVNSVSLIAKALV